MNVITTENVMLHLHGKNNQSDFFQKNPHVFTILHHFSKKWNKNVDITGIDSSQSDGFCNTHAACAETHKTLLAVHEKNTFLRVYKGQNEARNAR